MKTFATLQKRRTHQMDSPPPITTQGPRSAMNRPSPRARLPALLLWLCLGMQPTAQAAPFSTDVPLDASDTLGEACDHDFFLKRGSEIVESRETDSSWTLRGYYPGEPQRSSSWISVAELEPTTLRVEVESTGLFQEHRAPVIREIAVTTYKGKTFPLLGDAVAQWKSTRGCTERKVVRKTLDLSRGKATTKESWQPHGASHTLRLHGLGRAPITFAVDAAEGTSATKTLDLRPYLLDAPSGPGGILTLECVTCRTAEQSPRSGPSVVTLFADLPAARRLAMAVARLEELGKLNNHLGFDKGLLDKARREVQAAEADVAARLAEDRGIRKAMQATLQPRTAEPSLLERAKKVVGLQNDSNASVPAWHQFIAETTAGVLRDWIEAGREPAPPEVPLPQFPGALRLQQEKWETNKEFEARVEAARAERAREIERLQTAYRADVEARNAVIQRINEQMLQRTREARHRKVRIVWHALAQARPEITSALAGIDPDSGALFADIAMPGGQPVRYEFRGASPALRRMFFERPQGILLRPVFDVQDDASFGISRFTLNGDDESLDGQPVLEQQRAQMRTRTVVEIPRITLTDPVAQQSAILVDGDQVERIMYREENKTLRKHLDDMRTEQERAVAEESRRASAETERLRAEAEALRKRQTELEQQLRAAGRADAQGQSRGFTGRAIVVGNSAYPGGARLANAVGDAQAIAAKLRGMGFEVVQVTDTHRAALVLALAEFARQSTGADVTLLFYAGHGVQVDGTNYLLPVDLDPGDAAHVALEGISLNSVIRQYLPGKARLVFLDACRDNPFTQASTRGGGRGLAPTNAIEGTLIAYATRDGQVALDGNGRHSPFTTALLEHLEDPDDIAVILRKVREKVMRDTQGRQQPWEYGSLTGGALVLSAARNRSGEAR